MVIDSLTYTRLVEVLDYSPITGIFTNRIKRGNLPIGAIVGGNNDGYRYISIDYRKYAAHRLAWLYTYKTWPSSTIDHIDLNGYNNAIANLREATNTENNQNRLSIGNITGYRGVYKSLSMYAAHIRIEGITTYLGSYATAEEASLIYENKAKEVHKEFYNDPKYAYNLDSIPMPYTQKSSTGYTGVRNSGTKFKAVIKVQGINVRLGTFLTAEEASIAFNNKKIELGRS